MTLADIATVTNGTLSEVPDPQAYVTGPAASDSREVVPGGMFAAVTGAHVDGHDFAADATEAGAVCVLASRPVGVPAVIVSDVVAALGKLAQAMLARIGSPAVIALTGSSGKTSTKDLLAQVLPGLGPTVATPRSFNTEIGLPLTVLTADQSTRYLVLEMGARHKGDIAYLASLTPPQIGLVLNIGSAHIGEFGSKQAIAAAKGELAEALPDASHGGIAVLNTDDELVAAMAARTAADVVWYGQAPHADVQARDICIDGAGRARFTLITPSGTAPVTLRVRGEHYVSNALATAAVAHALGMGAAMIAAALSRAQPLSSGRMQVLERGDGVTIINDAFNANPESTRAGLRTLATMAAGRRAIAVLGEMRELGDYATTAHEQAGQLVGELGIAMLVAVGTDDAQALADTARRTNPALTAKVAPDRHAAADLLRDQLKPGDIVLVKASRSLQLEDLATALAAGPATPASQQQ
jgi:UDP-N-acetylmuramoyl-tripeptide--D-alanyl-D-alanine ligase